MTFDWGANWHKLNYWKDGNDIGISALNKLHLNQERALLQTQNELNDEIKKIQSIEVQDEDDEQELCYLQDELRYFEEPIILKLQEQQRYSMVLVIYSFVENRLKFICELVEKEYGYPKSKLNKSSEREDLKRYFNYLKTEFGAQTTLSINSFYILDEHKFVRKTIAHHQGIITSAQLSRAKVIIGNGLQLEDNQIRIEKDYIDYLIEQANTFFRNLALEIDKRYVELKSRLLT